MPRRSIAAQSTVPVPTVSTLEPRLPAPPALTAHESDVWQRTVAALPASHFRREQAELLLRYVKHTARAAQLDALLVDLDPRTHLDEYERIARLAASESRTALALARALRITNQSRLKAETAHNRAAAADPFAGWGDDERVAALVARRTGNV